jgi:hypothetical protein
VDDGDGDREVGLGPLLAAVDGACGEAGPRTPRT